MADIKWIKITTSMFDDEKIKLIRKMPESDAILLTWVQLLVQAGKANASGNIVLSETIPYNDEMLAAIFDRPIHIIRLALQTFQQFGMVDIEDGLISISNWDKHQNVEGMDRIREQTRKRVAEHRSKQKQLPSNDDCNVTVTQGNAIDIDKELDKEKEINKKHKYAEFVYMTEKEHEKLIQDYGQDNANRMIEVLDNYKGANGKKYKSDYRAIKNWVVDRVKEERQKNNQVSLQQKKQNNFDREVQLNRWIESGGDPDEFVYKPNESQ